MMLSSRNRNPFTPTQWQELEHQALIFKYMAAGMPIPPDLIFPIKRSLDSSVSSRLFPHQPLDWGCFPMGFGRKIDPEPGRCRRTDGKKWRCSKEAYPDSKYCERHMHRGRNRSRKPVEINTPTTTTTTNPISSFSNRTPSSTITTASNNNNNSSYSSLSSQEHHHPYINTPTHTFLYPHSPKSNDGISFSPQNNNNHLVLDSGSYSNSHEDHRYVNGLKEEGLDERSFFSEASGTLRSLPESSLNDPWRLTPLRMNSTSSYNQPKDSNYSDSQTGYSQFQLQQQKQKEQQEQQHCFILGTDFKSDRSVKTVKEESQQPLRHFFDEWPPKGKDSWLGIEDDQASHSTTQLSISIPMSSKDFSVSNSRS